MLHEPDTNRTRTGQGTLPLNKLNVNENISIVQLDEELDKVGAEKVETAFATPVDIAFDKAYAKYPRHEGKTKGRQLYLQYLRGRDIKGQGKTRFNHHQMYIAIQAFADAMDGRDLDKIKLFSTFMGSDIVDYVERTQNEYASAMRDKYGDRWRDVKFSYS